MENFSNLLIIILGITYSIILHEIAHGFVAYLVGDNTAKMARRLSLNPIRHIDPIGTIILPFILFIMNMPIFGWAKPVPVNPHNFRDRKLGMIFVSIAGVFVNFIIMILMFFLFSLFKIEAFLVIASLNLVLFIFNMLPFPPLDGYNFFSQFLPDKIRIFFNKNESTFLVIFLLLLATGAIRYIYIPIYNLLANFFLTLFLGGK